MQPSRRTARIIRCAAHRAAGHGRIEWLESRTLLSHAHAHPHFDQKWLKELKKNGEEDPPEIQYDPSIQPVPNAPPLSGTIEAINFDTEASSSQFYNIPPDPSGAAGPTQVVNVVNTVIQWFTKAGVNQNTQRLGMNGSTATGSFFAPLGPLTGTFDPKVLYDQYNGRFVVVALERTDTADGDPSNTSRILLAVSDDSDPNGTWYYTQINSSVNISGTDYWTDYPGFAVDANAIYVTGNEFSFGVNSFGGSRLWIISKSGWYTGGAPTSVNIYDPSALAGLPDSNFTMQPAHMFGTGPGSTGTFLAASGWLSGPTDFLSVIRINNPLASPTFINTFVSLGDVHNTTVAFPSTAPQSGTATRVATNDARMLNAVWRNNTLWATNEVNPPSGVDAGQATAHWYKISADSSTVGGSPLDQGNVGGEDIAAGTSTFFPSIMVDSANDMAMGFSASGSSIFPGAYYTGRLATDTAGTVQASTVLAAGSAFYVRTFGGGSNRWGDFSGIALDPSDSATFWVYNEYALPRGTLLSGEDGRWGTRFGKFAFLTTGNVTGTVYIDRNSNGVIDSGELGLNAVTVFLDTNNNGTLDAGETLTTTNSSGVYTFSGLLVGTYNVREVKPGGYVPTIPANGVNSVVVSTGVTSTQNFGNFPITYSGSGGDDSYKISLNGTTETITESLSAGPAVIYTIPTATLGSAALTFSPGAGDDTLIVDYAGGNPVVTGGVSFNGGTQINGDTFQFNGTAAADTETVTATSATNAAFPASPITLSGLELLSYAGATGADTLNVNGGAWAIASDVRILTPTLAISVSGAGTSLRFDSTQHLSALSVLSSASVSMSVNGNRYLDTKLLTIAPTSKLDLNDNDLVVQYGTSANPFTTIRDYVFTGYSGSVDPSKLGIISSTGQTAGNTIVGLFDNGLVGATEWPTGSGNTIIANSVAGKYTYFGDMDFDGKVTSDDYAILDAHLHTTPPPGLAWLNGDANLDGSITPDDYGILDANFGAGATSPL